MYRSVRQVTPPAAKLLSAIAGLFQQSFESGDTNNNNLRLLNCSQTAQSYSTNIRHAGRETTAATQGSTCTEGLSRLNCCHTRRTAIKSTAPA